MKKWILLIAALPLMICSGCKKDKIDYQGGRVVLVNSSDPAVGVTVQFLKQIIDANGNATYQVVASTVTDGEGKFDIDPNTEAHFVQASGSLNQYEVPSTYYSLGTYLREGTELQLTLIPKAWARFIIQDIAPLNPEVQIIYAYPIGSGSGVIPIDQGSVHQSRGNTPIAMDYFFYYANGTQSDWQTLNIPHLNPFDTSNVVLAY
ncbi:MAG: hypothetical protein ACKO6L_09965 [Flavobacteriales bacterium]